MLFITRLVTHDNEGESTAERREEVLREAQVKFGGYTLSGPDQGSWRDDDGRVYSEASYGLEIFCDTARLTEAREFVVWAGKRLSQKAMYFEVRYADGVEIIDTD